MARLLLRATIWAGVVNNYFGMTLGKDTVSTEQELQRLDFEMSKAVRKTAGTKIKLTDADVSYLKLKPKNRVQWTKASKAGNENPDDSTSLVENVIVVSDSKFGVGGTAVDHVSGFVETARLAVEIASSVTRWSEGVNQKQVFLGGILGEVQWQTESLCNVVMFDLSNNHENELKGIIFFARYLYGGAWFGLWVAESGSFKSKSRMGAKWGFSGDFSIKGLTKDLVTFNHRPCYKSPKKKDDQNVAGQRIFNSTKDELLLRYANNMTTVDERNTTEPPPEDRNLYSEPIPALPTFKPKQEDSLPIGSTKIKGGLVVKDVALKVVSAVESLFGSSSSKTAFYTALAHQLFYDLEQKCNIALWNRGIWHSNSLTGALYKTEVEYQGDKWSVWVVQGGSFYNMNLNPFLEPATAYGGNYNLDPTNRFVTFTSNDACFEDEDY